MAEGEPRRGTIWGLLVAIILEIPAIIVALVAAVLVAKQFDGPHKAGLTGALAVGLMLLAVLIVWLVLYFSFLRSRAPRRAIPYLGILLLVAMAAIGGLAALGHLSGERKAAAARVFEAQQLRTALAEAAKAEVASTARYGSVSNLHTQAPGEAGRIARAASVLLHTVSDAYTAFATKVAALEFPDFMMAKRLGADRDFAKATAALKQMRAAIEERQREVNSAYRAYRDLLSNVNIDPNLKRGALQHFDGLTATDKVARSREADLEMRVVTEMENLIGDLKREKGGWKVEDDTFMFTDEHALHVYRSHLSNIMSIKQNADKWLK